MAELLPSLDRPALSRPAVACGVALAKTLVLGAYRLAGGTALAWSLGHRRSDDLDFFTRQPQGQNSAAQATLAAQLHTIEPAGRINVMSDRTVHATVHGCSVSFFEIGGFWIEPPVPVAEGMQVASVADIAAMKVVSILTRSAKKDFYDLHALRKAGFDAERLYGLARAAQPEIGVDVVPILVRALVDFSDADLDPDPISLDGTTWPAVRRTAEVVSRELDALLKRKAIS